MVILMLEPAVIARGMIYNKEDMRLLDLYFGGGATGESDLYNIFSYGRLSDPLLSPGAEASDVEGDEDLITDGFVSLYGPFNHNFYQSITSSIMTNFVASKVVTHLSSDFQIATDPLFSEDSILGEALGVEAYKMVYTFDLDLDPEVEYYARARHIFNKYTSEWTNVDLIIPKPPQVNTIMDIPAVVSMPVVTIDYDVNNVPTTFFTISTTDIVTTSNSHHLFTTYIITDTDGNVYLSNIEDTYNLTSFKVLKEKLPENKTFILYVQHGANSHDISGFSCLVFTTTPLGDVAIISNTDMIKGNDLLIRLAVVPDVTSIDIKLYGIKTDINELLMTYTTDVFTSTIDKSEFLDGLNDYMLAVQYTYSDTTTSPIRYINITAY